MKEEVQEILKENSVIRLIKSSFLEKNYNELFNNINQFKQVYYNEVDLKFSQLVYNYSFDIKELPKCECTKNTPFKSFSEGYRQFCSNKCSANSTEKQKKIVKTCIKKYGEKNVSLVKKVKEKKKETFQEHYKKDHIWSNKEGEIRSCNTTCLEKYGVDNVFKLESVQKNISQTNLKTFGFKCPLQNSEVNRKSKLTLFKNWGVDNPMQSKEVYNKQKNTLFENYEVYYPMQSEEIREKAVENSLVKFGTNYPMQNKEVYNKLITTMLKIYGVENSMYLEEFRNKVVSTNRERYGVDYSTQNEEIWKKQIITSKKKFGVNFAMQNEEIQQKAINTSLKRYGFKNPMQSEVVQQKAINTLLEKHGTKCFWKLSKAGTSKIESAVCNQVGGRKFNFLGYEYDFIIGTDIFEIDGDFHHPIVKENLYFPQLKSLVNDKIKVENIKNSNYVLYRILTSKLPKKISKITVDLLKERSYIQNHTIEYDNVIINKEYISKYIEKYGLKKTIKYMKELPRICQVLGNINLPKEEIFDRIKILIKQKKDISFKNIVEIIS